MTSLDKGTLKSCQKRSIVPYPVDRGCKLNKMVRERPDHPSERLMNVQFTSCFQGFISVFSLKATLSEELITQNCVEHSGSETKTF